MRILIYIPNLNQNSGGIRQYALALLNTLGAIEVHTFFVLHNLNDPEVIGAIKKYDNLNLIPPKTGKEKAFERSLYNVTRGIQFLRSRGKGKDFKVRSYLDRLCRKYKIDIVHSPYQDHLFPRKAKNIFTLHDVQELHFPEYFSATDREYRARTYLYNLQRSDKVVVSYNHVKEDIIKFFDHDKEDIHVILLEMQNLWFTKFELEDTVETKPLHNFDQFIFYPANTWAHKNHISLLKAIKLLKDKGHTDIKLVCSGHQNDHFKHIQETISDLELEDQIAFVGLVDEITMYSLYLQCLGTVIPTSYEAGSYPLMESIIMNITGICSNVTS